MSRLEELVPRHPSLEKRDPYSALTRQRISICAPIITHLTFIDQDLSVLAETFDLHETQCASLFEMASCCLAAAKNDVTFCWFGSLRFLPAVLTAKIFFRTVVVVAGGYDVANVPEVPYGNMVNPYSRWLGRLLFKLSDAVLAVSKSTKSQAITEAGVRARKVRVVYNGVDDGTFQINLKTVQRLPKVLIVANIYAHSYRTKNIDYILSVARSLPEVQFEFAGKLDRYATECFLRHAPPNVKTLGMKRQDELRDLYYSSLIYFQPSLHESFGCAVAEAMICGCIPIVANRYALPEVVGGAGMLVDPTSIEDGVEAIRNVLEHKFTASENGRERVKTMFSLQTRSDALRSVIRELFQKTPCV